MTSRTPLVSNVTDTALVFEGGGMRNAYTAAVVSELLAEGLFFDHVSGISAGSSHVCNYVSRDAARSYATFVDIVDDPEFGGLAHFRKGEGLFNAEYIYERIARPEGAMPFDIATFVDNPATTRWGPSMRAAVRCAGSPRRTCRPSRRSGRR